MWPNLHQIARGGGRLVDTSKEGRENYTKTVKVEASAYIYKSVMGQLLPVFLSQRVNPALSLRIYIDFVN